MSATTVRPFSVQGVAYIRLEDAERLADAWVDESKATRSRRTVGEALDLVMVFAEAHDVGVEITTATYSEIAGGFRVDAFPFPVYIPVVGVESDLADFVLYPLQTIPAELSDGRMLRLCVWEGDDVAAVVQIDTEGGVDRLRVNVNDSTPFDRGVESGTRYREDED